MIVADCRQYVFVYVVSGRWLRCQIGYDHLPEIISSKCIYRTVLSLDLAVVMGVMGGSLHHSSFVALIRH